MLKMRSLGIDLKNPFVLSAGILGVSASSLIRAHESGAGAVTTKSISIEARRGHANPTVIAFEAGLLNAVGLSNPGIDAFLPEIKKVKEKNIPLIANAIGDTPKDIAKVATMAEGAGADIIEINPSCPNVIHKKPYASDPKLLSELTGTVKDAVKIPVLVKLSPNVDKIGTLAKTAEDAGADGITAVNTLGPGMIIDIASGKPVLDFKMGGISGPALRPVAVRCVYEIYEAVKIPILGVGGVTSGRDAMEMMLAGATQVGIGSAVYYRGADAFKKIGDETVELMKEHGYKNTKEITGVAHE